MSIFSLISRDVYHYRVLFHSLADRYCDILVNDDLLPPIRLLFESQNADHNCVNRFWILVQQLLFVDNYYQKKLRVNYRVYKLRKSDSVDSFSHVVNDF